jgi:hypothetical protein
MVKSADTADLKSADLNRSWGFKSPSGHQIPSNDQRETRSLGELISADAALIPFFGLRQMASRSNATQSENRRSRDSRNVQVFSRMVRAATYARETKRSLHDCNHVTVSSVEPFNFWNWHERISGLHQRTRLRIGPAASSPRPLRTGRHRYNLRAVFLMISDLVNVVIVRWSRTGFRRIVLNKAAAPFGKEVPSCLTLCRDLYGTRAAKLLLGSGQVCHG